MNRLECIVSMVDKCGTAADIGTDHGYVAEMLLNQGKCDKIIAADLNKGPLNRAMEHLSSVKLSERCDFRLGSGLTVLNEGEADAIIIAGMGGDLISEIIEASRDIALNTSQLILQPMTAVDNLRRYLTETGFEIVDENIVKEFHHFYFVIKARKGFTKYEDSIYYEISKSLVDKKEPIMFEYINKVLETNKKIIRSLEKACNMEYNLKIESIREKNEKLEELIK